MTMSRRGLLVGGASGAAAIVAILPLSNEERFCKADLKNSAKRVSTEKGDPGEILYAQCCVDGQQIRVWLDGVEQHDAFTADEGLGIVVRAMKSPRGNIMFNAANQEVLTETVTGKVVIEIRDRTV